MLIAYGMDFQQSSHCEAVQRDVDVSLGVVHVLYKVACGEDLVGLCDKDAQDVRAGGNPE
jgi:hypothetical protein